MKKGNKEAVSKIFYLIMIFFLIMLLLLSIYIFYLVYSNLLGTPENLSVIVKTKDPVQNSSLSQVKQFNVNMKFNHNNLSYLMDENCGLDKKERMKTAFLDLENKIGIIHFIQVLGTADIQVSCSQKDEDLRSEYFIAGEGGAKEIIQTGRYNVITEGVVLLYKYPKTAIKCKHPNVELHELIHVFGFDHSSNEESLMYPYLSSCDQLLDDSIINEIIRLYSEENLPELYFEN